MTNPPGEKLKAFFASSRPVHYKKGEIVLRLGEDGAGAFFISRGYVKDSTISLDGREFTLFIFQPNDVFSYNWIYNKIPNGHSLRAMTDCVIFEKSRERLLHFLGENPDVQLMITQNIVTRMTGLSQRIEQMVFGDASQKVYSIISILAERFGRAVESGIIIPIQLTQKDIAELVGLSRETTSSEIKRLMDDGIISRRSGLYTVTDMKKLQKLANY